MTCLLFVFGCAGRISAPHDSAPSTVGSGSEPNPLKISQSNAIPREFENIMNGSGWVSPCFQLKLGGEIHSFVSILFFKDSQIVFSSFHFQQPKCQGQYHLLFTDIALYKISSVRDEDSHIAAVMTATSENPHDYRSMRFQLVTNQDGNAMQMIFVSSLVYGPDRSLTEKPGWPYASLFEHQVFRRFDPKQLPNAKPTGHNSKLRLYTVSDRLQSM